MIRKFEIRNDRYGNVQGVLCYDDVADRYSMNIDHSYSTARRDIFFDELVKQGVHEVPQHLVDMWVRGRVFPPNRQGARGMLDVIGLKEWDLFKLLMHYEGRCQMDYSYLHEVF